MIRNTAGWVLKRARSLRKYLETYDMEHLKLLAKSAKRENRHIDFKESFDPSSSQEWARIIKDIVAFANSGGGVIVFGVRDDGTAATFDKNIVLRVDPAVIADKISAYTGENFADFEIAEIIRRKKHFAALFINPSSAPLVFTRAGADLIEGGKQKSAFVKGSVYFRHGAKSDLGTTNDLRAVISREVNRLRKSWLQGVRKIASIAPGDEVVVNQFSKSTTAKVPGRIVTDKNAQTFRPENAAEIWPYRSKELVAEISKELKKKLSNHDLICIKRQYGIDEKSHPDFVHKPYSDVSPRYSKEFIRWLLTQVAKKPKLFQEARDLYRRSMKRK